MPRRRGRASWVDPPSPDRTTDRDRMRPRYRFAMIYDGEHRIALNGVDHWVRVAGAGPGGVPLVLVHGGPGGNAFSLEHSVGPHLAGKIPVVYYDQRGGGRSGQDPAGDYSIARFVADIEALRVALDAATVRLAGFSFGGQLAAEYAVAYPDRVDRLVLAAPTIHGPLARAARLAGMDAVGDAPFRAMLRAHVAGMAPSTAGPGLADLTPMWLAMGDRRANLMFADPARALDAPVLAAAPDPALRPELLDEPRARPLLDDLAEVMVPTLVTVGLYDRMVGVDACRDITDRMSRARLVVLDRCGHNTVEQSEEHAARITDFLAA
jgi:proline iminopeptidase